METIDYTKEFNNIVDSIKVQSKFSHDRYFRFAFAKPKRMVELLQLFAKNNSSLQNFLNIIDLKSLRGDPENFSSDVHTGSADLVFEAKLKNGGTTGLYVGLIIEHKFTDKDDVLQQLLEYQHHLFLEKKIRYSSSSIYRL